MSQDAVTNIITAPILNQLEDKTTFEALPLTGNNYGDGRKVTADGVIRTWNGVNWKSTGEKAFPAAVVTKTEANDILLTSNESFNLITGIGLGKILITENQVKIGWLRYFRKTGGYLDVDADTILNVSGNYPYIIADVTSGVLVLSVGQRVDANAEIPFLTVDRFVLMYAFEGWKSKYPSIQKEIDKNEFSTSINGNDSRKIASEFAVDKLRKLYQSRLTGDVILKNTGYCKSFQYNLLKYLEISNFVHIKSDNTIESYPSTKSGYFSVPNTRYGFVFMPATDSGSLTFYRGDGTVGVITEILNNADILSGNTVILAMLFDGKWYSPFKDVDYSLKTSDTSNLVKSYYEVESFPQVAGISGMNFISAQEYPSGVIKKVKLISSQQGLLSLGCFRKIDASHFRIINIIDRWVGEGLIEIELNEYIDEPFYFGILKGSVSNMFPEIDGSLVDFYYTGNNYDVPTAEYGLLNGRRTNIYIEVEKVNLQKKTGMVWGQIGTSITDFQDGYTSVDGPVPVGNVPFGYTDLVNRFLKFKSNYNYGYGGKAMVDMHLYFADFGACDIYTIEHGTNDHAGNVPLGTINDYINATGHSTFYGAARELNDYLLTLNSMAIIAWMTPVHKDGRGIGSHESFWVNTQGLTLIDYVVAVKKIAELSGGILIDVHNDSGIKIDNVLNYTFDGIHPNSRGYMRIGRSIINKINTLI